MAASVQSRPKRPASRRRLELRPWASAAGLLIAAALYVLACPPYARTYAAWGVPGLALLSVRPLRTVAAFFSGLVFALLVAYGLAHAAINASVAGALAQRNLQAVAVLAMLYGRPALVYAGAAMLFSLATRRVWPIARAPIGAALWVGAEVACAQLSVPLPWEILGLTQLQYPLLLPVSHVAGMYGVSFLLAFVSIATIDAIGGIGRRVSNSKLLANSGIGFGLCAVAIGSAYVGTIVLFGWVLPNHPAWAPSLQAQALVNAALLLVMMAAAAAARAWFDRQASRKEYEVDKALAALSKVLASARAIDQVVSHTGEVLATTVRPQQISVFLRDPDGRFRRATPAAEGSEALVSVAPDLLRYLHRGEPFSSHEWKDGAARLAGAIGSGDDLTLFVPICMNGSTIALMTLGQKRSGRPYDAYDRGFLRTAANQIALALTNALVLDQLGTLNKHLEQLNENLERQVEERTAALHAVNEDLSRSIEKVQQAYGELEHSQRSLLQADRLATLGHLTAGLAHEMNTPLSAVLNSLKIITELGQEYASAIDDPQVLPADHHEIAKEIISSAQAATQWAHKAAAFIRSVKAHGRETRPTLAQRFLVRDVVKDTRGLLAHRLRVAACQIEFIEEPAEITLVGDPGRFGQVLVNLITNAIDAYEERNIAEPRIELRASRANGVVNVQVRDWAGGIPANVLPHIFENMFTTKGPGRGTGLGLWIARNLVEEGFGGKLDVLTTTGGSCFCATLPDRVATGDEEPSVPERRPAELAQTGAQSG